MPTIDSSELYAIIVVIISFMAVIIMRSDIQLLSSFIKGESSEDPSPKKAVKKRATASKSFKAIPDQFKTVSEVRSALRGAGLESSGLIVAVDFTKSNTWTGERTFGGKCLHHLDTPLPGSPYEPNPYQICIESLGRTLGDLDEEKRILLNPMES